MPSGTNVRGGAWEPALAAGREDGRLVRESSEPATMAKLAELPHALDPALAEALGRAGISVALLPPGRGLRDRPRARADPDQRHRVGEVALLQPPGPRRDRPRPEVARALYLYPTKALAQDQARKLGQLRPPNLREAIYDGDTPREERPAIRRRANLVLTNPDMLNVGVLPHHKRWGDFLANLGWVVVDEAHTYRGVFGSHVANVLRRLRRVARIYGAEPRFIMASATIANPGELAERLTGLEFDAARRRRRPPRGPRDRDVEPARDRRGDPAAALGGLRGGRPARASSSRAACGRSAS